MLFEHLFTQPVQFYGELIKVISVSVSYCQAPRYYRTIGSTFQSCYRFGTLLRTFQQSGIFYIGCVPERFCDVIRLPDCAN